MLLLDSTNIPERLTSFTAECLAVRDNCVASTQARKHARTHAPKQARTQASTQTLNIIDVGGATARTVRQARLVSFAVGCIP